MTKTIWIMWKPGEERVYTMAVQPPEPWATTQKGNGYFIASFDVELPDPTVSQVQTGPLQLRVYPSRIDQGQPTIAGAEVTNWYGCTSVRGMTGEEAQEKRPGFVPPDGVSIK